jgi:Baseplate J-like protein
MVLLPSRLDFYTVGRNYVIGRAKQIDPAVVDVEGSNANILVAVPSFMAQAVTRHFAEALRAHTLDATGEDLDREVLDRFPKLPRKGAAPAVAPIEFSRASAAAGAGSIPVGTRLQSLAGVDYVTLTNASFGASQLSGVQADARAVQAGFEYQVGANQIRRFADASQIFDPTIQVNNPDAAAGGAPREEDPDYANRARAYGNITGTLAAIEAGALTVPGVASALAAEVLSNGVPARLVTLVVADLAGVCNRVLAAQVVAKLREFRGGGVGVVVLSSVPEMVSVELALQFVAGVDTATLASNIRSAVVDYVNGLGAGQSLLRGDLFAVLSRYKSQGLVVGSGSIPTPAGDVVPDPGRTLRARLEDVVVL